MLKEEMTFIFVTVNRCKHKINHLRYAANGQKIQIGQYYNSEKKEIIWAFPRLFDGKKAMENSGELMVEYFTKEDFQKQIHDLKVSASVKLKLAMDIPGCY